MKIALDALGGDYGAEPNVLGAVKAVKDYGYEIILVGDEVVIRQCLAKSGYKGHKISVVHAPDVIDMHADPVKECRSKKTASIVVCAALVKKGEADAFVSAGHSGASMVAALFGMGRIKGVTRPAIGAMIPHRHGHYLLADSGANVDCKPLNLMQFAVMGSAYMKSVYNMPAPKVGLLSIGEEESKGNAVVKETYPYLKSLGINFYGMIEGRDLAAGTTDVVVCDGFVGNICLKLSEGMAKTILTLIKEQVKKRFLSMVGGALMKPSLREIKNLTDPDMTGGAPLLGVDGIAIISHGKSSATGIYNAIKIAAKLVDTKFVQGIKDTMETYAPIFKQLEGKN